MLDMSFEQQSDTRFRRGRERFHPLAEDTADARTRFKVSVQDIDDRRFAGPVLTQKSQNLPLFDFKVQILID